MKKVLTFALVATLLLTSCTIKNDSASKTISKPDDSEQLQTEKSAYTQLSSLTNDGYYTINTWYDKNNIMFTDFEAQQQVYACSAPNCEHNTDVCTSVFEGYGKLYATDENLFIVFDSGVNEGKIMKTDRKGGQREIIFERADTEFMGNGEFPLLINGDWLYFEVTDTLLDKKYIQRNNLKTGAFERSIGFETSVRPIGAVGDKIVLYEQILVGAQEALSQATACINRVSLLNYETGEITQVINEELSIANSKTMSFHVEGEYAYMLFAGSSENSGSLFSQSLLTGEKKLISDKCPTTQAEITWSSVGYGSVEAVLGDKILVSIAPEKEPNPNIDAYKLRYAIDVNTGEITPTTLEYLSGYGFLPIDIIAQTDTDFFVISDARKETKTIQDNYDGTVKSFPQYTEIYALISKEDFFANVPNYREIMPVHGG